MGIPAEKPQAIVTNLNGKKELIIAGLGDGNLTHDFDYTEIIKSLENVGLKTNDLQSFSAKTIIKHGVYSKLNYNGQRELIEPEIAEFNSHIIDVNRWQWSPHTDASYKDLLNLIRYEVEDYYKNKNL